MIPMVVKMAIVEQAMRIMVKMASTWLRARRPMAIRLRTNTAAAAINAIVITASALWLMDRSIR